MPEDDASGKGGLMENLCRSCPRGCQVDRTLQTGFCGTAKDFKIAKAYLHPFEEPMISGSHGSGTVFFSGCSLRCVFCQNHDISEGKTGVYVTQERLAEIFLELQEKGAENINLVTPTHYAQYLPETIQKAKAQGLTIPIVYNSGGYERVEVLKSLRGLIDIYIPDLKYFKDEYALKYSGAQDYFRMASAAVSEMYSQTGPFVLDSRGMMTKGMIIRHLCLPGLTLDSKLILKHISKTYGDRVYVSIMNQYTPMHKAKDYPQISGKLPPSQYKSILAYAQSLGLTNCLVQDSDSQSESFTPVFDLMGI